MTSTAAIPSVQTVPRFVGHGRFEVWERPVPQPGDGELLLRVRANALCGTDRGQLAAGSDVTPGHEAAGEVAAAGAGTSTPVGTAGVVYLMDYCGECRSCREGATNRCAAKRADMGFTHDGGFGWFELVHETNFFPVGEDVPCDDATLLLDVMGTTGHALGRALAVRPAIRSIAIAGAGPVGLGAVAMTRLLLGPDVGVYVADIVPYRLELAARLGATPVHLPVESVPAVDAAVDTSGRADARRTLLDALERGGVLVCVGHGEGLTLDVSHDLIAPERAVLGSEYFRYDELGANLELLRAHRSYLRRIITHRFGIDELEEAYRVFLSGESGKVVVTQ